MNVIPETRILSWFMLELSERGKIIFLVISFF